MKEVLYSQYMALITVKIQQKTSQPKKFSVEINAQAFERLVASFGFFSSDFLKSLERAERDYKFGRIKKIKSLRELKK